MSAPRLAAAEPAVEVLATASRRRVTMEYDGEIAREAGGGKTPGDGGGAAAPRGAGLVPRDRLARGAGAGRVSGAAELAAHTSAMTAPSRRHSSRPSRTGQASRSGFGYAFLSNHTPR